MGAAEGCCLIHTFFGDTYVMSHFSEIVELFFCVCEFSWLVCLNSSRLLAILSAVVLMNNEVHVVCYVLLVTANWSSRHYLFFSF
jgi:hypothetical protein